MVSSISGPQISTIAGNTGVSALAYQKDADGDNDSKEVIKDRDDAIKTSAVQDRVSISSKAQAALSVPAGAPASIPSQPAVNRQPGIYQSYKGQNIDIKA